MARFEFERVFTSEEVKNIVEKDLGSGFKVTVSKNRIVVAQTATRGCIIRVLERKGRTICKGPFGFMPSGKHRAMIMFGTFAFLFLMGLSMGYLVIGMGAIPMIILLILMRAPSQELVKKVAGILDRHSTLSNLQRGVEALPEVVSCPHCGEGLELEGYEREARRFTCPECGRLVEMDIGRDRVGPTL